METKPQGGYCKSRWNKLASNVFGRQVRGRHGRAGSKLLFLSNIPMCFHIVNSGLKVFMDAHSTVTAEEGDRYPLGPPGSLQGHSLPQTSVTGVTVEERPEPNLFRKIQAWCKDLTVNQ